MVYKTSHILNNLIWAFFLLLTIWWVGIQTNFFSPIDLHNQIFTGTYGLMAVFGSVLGIYIGYKWGGFTSLIGRGIIMLALGLLSQEVGQIIYYLYIYIYKIEVPYPSLGDIGFFSTIIFYTYGIILIAQASGVRIKLSSYHHRMSAILIPTVMVIISYTFFLRNYEFDWNNPMVIFLDFAYPIGQAVNISLALVTFFLTRSVLGGKMKSKIRFIIFALFMQYCADFIFLYQAHYGQWTVSGVSDYVYLLAYFTMSIGLFNMYKIYVKSIIKN